MNDSIGLLKRASPRVSSCPASGSNLPIERIFGDPSYLSVTRRPGPSAYFGAMDETVICRSACSVLRQYEDQ